ncbi:MAG: Hpt domain-containing protein [Deltaproteobacteria bacterium]|nr:Hpt domain-containing protein [Deltaproteobacteria bacterium]
MSLIGIEPGREPIRQEILGLTSDLRNAVERLDGAGPLETAFDDLTTTTAALARTTSRLGHAVLVRWSEVLDRVSLLGRTIHQSARPGTRDLLSGLVDAVGTVERAFDACLDGEPESRFERLDASLRATIPEAWRSYVDLEGDAFRQRLATLLPPPAAARETTTVAQPAESDDAAFQRELFDAFMTEVSEAFERCEELLVTLEKAPNDHEVINALFREFHTLKGAAAAVELGAASEQLHHGESLLQSVRDGDVELSSTALVDFLLQLEDSVKALIDRACGRDVSAEKILDDVPERITRLIQGDEAAAERPVERVAGVSRSEVPSRIPSAAAQPTAGFDPLPALADLRRKVATGQIDPQLLQIIDALDQRAQHFSQVAASLQQEVVNLRTAPLDGVFRRLQRPVRDAARHEGKFVELLVNGGDLRVDRTVAEKLAGPLLHLVRNAVAHGIEVPALREARGKPRGGNVHIAAQHQGVELVVTVSDDGGGLDFESIRSKALARGWIDAAKKPGRDELAQLVFRPGLSTREDVTELAGRGVGMDVVAREVEELHGRVAIESHDGKGTTVRLYVPDAAAVGAHA